MYKQQLLDRVSKKTGIKDTVVKLVVDETLIQIEAALVKRQAVVLTGFGKFVVRKRKKRVGINPATREPMTILAHKVAQFVTGAGLKRAVK